MKAKLLSAAAAALMAALILVTLPLAISGLLGVQVYSILTESMTPTLPVGSAIFVQPCLGAELEPGDIVTFALSAGTDLVETHRVVQNDAENGQLITKGDANALADIDPVAYGRVVGRMAFAVPLLGGVNTALHTKAGIAGCVAVFILAFVLWTLADQYKKGERFK